MECWTDKEIFNALNDIIAKHVRKYDWSPSNREYLQWHMECLMQQKKRNKKPRMLVGLNDTCSCLFIEGKQIEFDDCGESDAYESILKAELELTNPPTVWYEIDWIRRKITRKTTEYVNRVWLEGGLIA